MTSSRFITVTAIAVGCTIGCARNPSVRLPTWHVGNPEVERRSLERHGAFPSRSMGPPTDTRPQGHIEQRTDVRRLREENALRGLDRRGIPAGPGSTTNFPYPAAVRE
ncbi:MAG: hypothetical protein ACE5KM_08985 [Planctomycetaceae bacterium]